MIEKIIITSFLVFFLYGTMLPGMIFSNIRVMFASLADFYKKPFFDCAFCMTPWYGSIIYWSLWHSNIKEYIIVIFAAGGLNFILLNLFKYDE